MVATCSRNEASLAFSDAVGAQRERAAVVDHLVLSADLVEIDQRQAALDHAVDGELHAHVGLADLVGRGVGHQQDLAAGLGDAFDDVGRPDVLADRHADAHALDHQRPRHRTGREDALVVEHAVVRQVDLVALADDLAFVEADDGVVELAVLAPRRGDEQRRAAVLACRRATPRPPRGSASRTTASAPGPRGNIRRGPARPSAPGRRPASLASARAARTLARLPATSPTLGLSWASATLRDCVILLCYF